MFVSLCCTLFIPPPHTSQRKNGPTAVPQQTYSCVREDYRIEKSLSRDFLFLTDLILNVESNLCHRLQILLEALHPRGSVCSGHGFSPMSDPKKNGVVESSPLCATAVVRTPPHRDYLDRERPPNRELPWGLRVRAGREELKRNHTGKERREEHRHRPQVVRSCAVREHRAVTRSINVI